MCHCYTVDFIVYISFLLCNLYKDYNKFYSFNVEVPLTFAILQRVNKHYSLFICDFSCHSPDIPSLFLFSHLFPYSLYIGGSGGTSAENGKVARIQCIGGYRGLAGEF